ASFKTTKLIEERTLFIGATYRPQSPPDTHSLDQAGLTVIVYGHPLEKPGSWRVATASDLARRIANFGRGSLRELDGSFLIVTVDRHQGKLEIINDRNGSLPLVYAEADGCF